MKVPSHLKNLPTFAKYAGVGIIFLALGILFYPSYYNSTLSQEMLFCMGKNPNTQELQLVRFAEGRNGRGRIRVFTLSEKEKNPVTTLTHEDKGGYIHRESAKGFLSRLSLQIRETEKLLVVRDCGDVPVCRFENVKYISIAEYEAANKNLSGMENEAAETRREIARLAEKNAGLQKELVAEKTALDAASGADKKAARERYKKVTAQVRAAAKELHDLSENNVQLQKKIKTAPENG